MVEQARCKKCGRVLKSPASIARRMGSTCAGISPDGGKSFRLGIRKGSDETYSTAVPNKLQDAAAYGELPPKPISHRERFRRTREERRERFEQRMPFQCGVLARTNIPVIFVPLGEGRWKENHSGRIIPHERLQAYLKRFSLI